MSGAGMKRKDRDVDEDERFARLCIKNWVSTHNAIATTLIRLAMSCPSIITMVEDYESKLYTAITNVAWVNDKEKTACWMSMRTASRLAAFIKSMLSDTKRMNLDCGPYLVAKTGEDLKQEDENGMHDLLRELGFRKVEVRVDDSFLKEMRAKYDCTEDDFEPDDTVFRQEFPFWENAVLSWAGSGAMAPDTRCE